MEQESKWLKTILKRNSIKSCALWTYRSLFALRYFVNRGIYFGNRFTCPVCNGHFRKFLPYGIKLRQNAKCPSCGAMERHRLLWLYLKDRTGFFDDNLKILDIAPTWAFQEKCKKLKNIDYVSGDILSPIAMIKTDITDTALPDNKFDCIICYHVLEHVPNDKKAMEELFRILKPGGWAILQSPVDGKRNKTFEDPNVVRPNERAQVFGNKSHVRIYGRDYKDRLERAGFSVELDNYVGELDSEKIKTYGLMKNERMYFCTKPKA